MKLLFTPEALVAFNELKTSNSREADQVKDTIKEILSHSSSGKGNPMPLSGALYGLWKRDYGVFRQLVYSFTDEEVKMRANASDGRITCSELHEDVWKKEFYRQRYKGDGTGLFVGQYQDKPRGRVFYNIDNETFEVACGKWLQKYPHVYDMILKEFDLPSERTTAKYAIHWDIGHSWR